MRIGIIGSRSIHNLELEDFLPEQITQIISGGARGIDTIAKQYATTHNIPLLEFLPEYKKFHRAAPLKRNLQIIEHSDIVIAFWDGCSRGTAFTVTQCQKRNVPITVYLKMPDGTYRKLP